MGACWKIDHIYQQITTIADMSDDYRLDEIERRIQTLERSTNDSYGHSGENLAGRIEKLESELQDIKYKLSTLGNNPY